MSALSPNGWPVSPDPDEIDIVPFVVAGVTFYGGVRGGRVHDVLMYVASAVHSRVQPVNQAYGCYGWNYRANANDPSVWSNHASATAIDFNATKNGNGVPTASIWTPAQIAEVHAILAEVDNVVRWGGDYTSTPDSMHFEIDVSPVELEGSSFEFPTAATRWPMGSPGLSYGHFDELPILTEMSVSYPTLAAWIVPGTLPGHAFWQYTASATGRVSIDALHSHYISPEFWTEAGPNVTLQVHKVMPTGALQLIGTSSSFPGGFGIPARNQGRLVLSVEEGQQYVIETATSPEYPYIRTVVRIGEVSEAPDWTQPPDQVRVWAHEDGQWGSTPGRKDTIVDRASRFEGGDVDIYRSFGGPHPATVSAAVQCSWKWSRRMNAEVGAVYWSPDNGVEWNGGPGSCPLFTHGDTNSGAIVSDPHYLASGWTYGAEPDVALLAGHLGWSVYAGSELLDPQDIVDEELASGVGTMTRSLIPYLPAAQPNEIFQWESEFCTLMDLDFSIDNLPGHNDHMTETLVSGLYVGDVDYEGEIFPGEDPPGGHWGPWGREWVGQSVGGSPESWAASQHQIASYSGTPTSWGALINSHWSDGPGEYKWCRFTLMSAAQQLDGVPSSVPGVETDEYAENFYYAYVALRSTVRPSRYRIWPDPGIEDIDWAGVGAIMMSQTDAGQVLY